LDAEWGATPKGRVAAVDAAREVGERSSDGLADIDA
jgi:hypothetical protein